MNFQSAGRAGAMTRPRHPRRENGNGWPRALRGFGLVAAAGMLSVLLGCGADPGGDFLDDGFGSGLPIGGVMAELQLAYQKLETGSWSASRGKFLTILDDNPTDQEASQAQAGVGFVDTRQGGTSEGIAEFERAFELDNLNPDARVGLAGALISRGAPVDINRAITLIRGLDTGNVNFIYEDRYRLGISNAEVHALLAYALRVDGQTVESNVQRGIAQQLDANVNDTTVDQILDVLAFLP